VQRGRGCYVAAVLRNEEVLAAVNKEFAGTKYEVRTEKYSQFLMHKGLKVSIGQDPGVIVAEKNDPENGQNDTIVFSFSGEGSGNALVMVKRKMEFRDPLKAVTMNDMVKQFTTKFGEPTPPTPGGFNYGRSANVEHHWLFKNGQHVSENCMKAKVSCGYYRYINEYNLNWQSGLTYDPQQAADFEVQVTISPHPRDPEKVGELFMRVLPMKAYVAAVQQDMAALKKKAEEEHSKSAVSVSAPKL